eukprot:764231-Hanusia_phi.AAC.2
MQNDEFIPVQVIQNSEPATFVKFGDLSLTSYPDTWLRCFYIAYAHKTCIYRQMTDTFEEIQCLSHSVCDGKEDPSLSALNSFKTERFGKVNQYLLFSYTHVSDVSCSGFDVYSWSRMELKFQQVNRIANVNASLAKFDRLNNLILSIEGETQHDIQFWMFHDNISSCEVVDGIVKNELQCFNVSFVQYNSFALAKAESIDMEVAQASYKNVITDLVVFGLGNSPGQAKCVPSPVYVLEPDNRTYVLLQNLGSEFKSVPTARADMYSRKLFCLPSCLNSDSDFSTPCLRGVQKVYSFVSDGTSYLAVGQLSDVNAQPKSTILQFNVKLRKFTELSSITELDNLRLRNRDLTSYQASHHGYNLRIDGGGITQWQFYESASGPKLLATSREFGIVEYSFFFHKLQSLTRAVAVVSDNEGKSIMVANGINNSIASFAEVPASTSFTGWRCDVQSCLQQRNSTSGAYLGVNGMYVQEVSSTMTTVAVFGSTFPDERLCCENSASHFPCQSVDFNVTSQDSWQLLFEDMPTISPNGTLCFSAKGFRGESFFSARISDHGFNLPGSSSLTSPSHDFAIKVLPNNHIPTFQAFDVTGVAGGRQTLIFAVNVSAGLNDVNQTLSWSFRFDSPQLFIDTPALGFTTDQEQLVGTVSFSSPKLAFGSSRFHVSLSDNGPGDASAGNFNRSTEQTFTLSLFNPNSPPTFTLLAGVYILEGTEQHCYHNFATKISPGPWFEAQQNLTFSLGHVDALASMWNGSDLLSSFHMSTNGTLCLSLNPYVNGNFLVSIMLQDDGGTARNGSDHSESSFSLKVQPVNTAPSFRALFSHIIIPSLDSGVYSKQVVLVAQQPLDERGQRQTFVTSLANDCNSSLFLRPPHLNLSGYLNFEWEGFWQGTCDVRFVLVDDGGTSGGGRNMSQPSMVALDFLIVNQPPSFAIPQPELTVVQGSDYTLQGFAVEISPGTSKEVFQTITFIVNVVPDGTFVFSSIPTLHPDGTLTFSTSPEEFGSVVLQVLALDNGGTAFGGQDTSPVHEVNVQVLPRPKILSVVPSVASLQGNTTVTISALFVEPLLSNATFEAQVFFGVSQCLDVSFVGGLLQCRTPPLSGSVNVQVVVKEGHLTRASNVEVKYAALVPPCLVLLCLVHAIVVHVGFAHVLNRRACRVSHRSQLVQQPFLFGRSVIAGSMPSGAGFVALELADLQNGINCFCFSSSLTLFALFQLRILHCTRWQQQQSPPSLLLSCTRTCFILPLSSRARPAKRFQTY